MIALYKLLHKPTGLFFTPSKGAGNLSKKGKIYVNTRPNLTWADTIRVRFYTESKRAQNKILIEHFKIDVTGYVVDEYFKTNPEDWEVVQL